MASNKTVKDRYSSYITRKIFYIKMLNKIKIVELFKKKNYCLWYIEKKKYIYYWLKFKELTAYKKLRKKRPSKFKGVSSRALNL